MVVNQIYVADIGAVEAEHYAPVPRNCDRPLPLSIAGERMQAIARSIYFLGSSRGIQVGEDVSQFRRVFWWDASRVSVLEEPSQALMPKTYYHI
jgi:hypothetical protein